MAAGASRQQISAYIHGMKQRDRRELEAAGVLVTVPKGEHCIGGAGWSIRYDTLRASNGEVAILPRIEVNGPEGPENYGFEAGSARPGYDRIIHLYGEK